MLEGQGLAVLDLERIEDPSRLSVGVCCSLGVTSLLRPRARIVWLCRRTEEDLRSAWLARGLTLEVFTLSLVSLSSLVEPLWCTTVTNYIYTTLSRGSISNTVPQGGGVDII